VIITSGPDYSIGPRNERAKNRKDFFVWKKINDSALAEIDSFRPNGKVMMIETFNWISTFS
jgi:hypothetical protein